jgi:hypothetical protein
MKNTEFRTLGLIALIFVFAGCGVDWFPAITRAATTPNPFSFTTKVGVPIFSSVSSNAVQITGFKNSTTAAPISISSGSAYSINGAVASTTAGTIKNNDSVKVIQTTSSLPGAPTVSTLTIGTASGTFTTVTQTIATPIFTQIFPSPRTGFIELSATITGTDVGGHTLTMTGTNTEFAISDSNNVITTNFTNSTGQFSVPFLNNQHILLLIPSTSASTDTILTIDNTNFKIHNTAPFGVSSTPK